MAESHPQFTATVLLRHLAGENHLRLLLASSEHGLSTVFCRNSNGKTPPPDLFDSGDFQTNLSNSGSLFLRDFHLTHRRSALARNYQAFRHACGLASVFARNLDHVEQPAPAIDVFHRALDAFESGLHPEVTFFKSLYLFARTEGFPVKEGWWMALPADLRQAAQEILNYDLQNQIHPAETTHLLTARLREWLSLHAGFVFTNTAS